MMNMFNIRIACLIVLMNFRTSFIVRAQEQLPSVVTYTVGHYKTVYSNVLDEDRTILVNLPDDYETSRKQYPVLYILDGEATHRFIHSIAAITFYSGVRRLPRMIVVGILNTDRTRDMTPRKVVQRQNSGGGDAFLKFIISELKPYIECKYRSAPYRILFGGSLAGMLTLYSLFSQPEFFDGYIASRPALNSLTDYTWDSDVIFQKARNFFVNSKSLKKSLFIDYGEQEDALHDPEPIQKLSAIFKLNPLQDFRWKIQSMGESGYRSAESLKNGLLAVFDGWHYSADLLFAHGFAGLENHAKRLSERFGYPITVADLLTEKDLLMFGYRFLENENLTEAIALFKYAVAIYFNSWNAFDSLAEAYLKAGQKDLAIKNYEKSLELNPENTNAVEKLRQLQ